MKSFYEVEANRIAYHQFDRKNTVHRSSLIVPRFECAKTNISFLNHFLLKRNNKNVVLKITGIDDLGKIVDTLSFEICEPRVYSFNLEDLFTEEFNIMEYIVEFFSHQNLFIPFPAVMINHIGSDFINSIHSYNRVLNDIFEDDLVNKIPVYESSIDVLVDDEYDTFFNFCTGPLPVKENIELLFSGHQLAFEAPTALHRLTNKNYYLSSFTNKGVDENTILKVLQPKQPLFFGRLLSGRVNKATKSFSANHSYYDSSTINEYFNNGLSSRSYPFFENCFNKITMYPIMSPSSLDIYIEVYDGSNVFRSPTKHLESPSNDLISFDINEIVDASGLTHVTLFKVFASSPLNKIPTRVSHQLIYGAPLLSSKLHSSVSISLINESFYIPANKQGLIWGQVLLSDFYESKLGICFNNNSGPDEEILISFYGEQGLIFEIKKILSPKHSLIFDSDFFNKFSTKNEFIWFWAKSIRPDLQGQSFHFHKLSGNASGEHSF